MLSVRRLAVLLFAALWLPATLHCRLEGAGLLFDFRCCEAERPIPVASDSHGCADDSCDVAEGDFTGPATASAKVSGPAAATALPFHRMLAVSVPLDLPPGMGVSESTAAPPGLTEPTRLVLPGPLAPRAP